VLIARDSTAVAFADTAALLSGLAERYWRGRAMAALLQHDRPRAFSFAFHYPVEFAHAVGRLRDSSLQAQLDLVYETQKANPEFLCLYLWALGKLANERRLQQVISELDKLYPDELPAAHERMQPPSRPGT
jgi:hypothetical protein